MSSAQVHWHEHEVLAWTVRKLVRGGQAVTSNAPSSEYQNILTFNHGRQVYVPDDRIPNPCNSLGEGRSGVAVFPLTVQAKAGEKDGRWPQRTFSPLS